MYACILVTIGRFHIVVAVWSDHLKSYCPFSLSMSSKSTCAQILLFNWDSFLKIVHACLIWRFTYYHNILINHFERSCCLFLYARLETGRIMWLGMAGGCPHRFPYNNFSSVYPIFTKLGHMIPLWMGKNPIYFGFIRSKVKVTITINIIFNRLIIYIDWHILWCTYLFLVSLRIYHNKNL